MMNDVLDHEFHNEATATGNGKFLEVKYFKTLTVEIFGTSASRTVTFYAKSASGTLRALMGVKLSDYSIGTSTTGTGEIWQFDITGLHKVYMDLTAVSGGNVTIIGRAVS